MPKLDKNRLSFKWVPSQGKVSFQGFQEISDCPCELQEVLKQFGFLQISNKEWTDNLKPTENFGNVENLLSNVAQIARYVNLDIRTERSKNRVLWFVEIDGTFQDRGSEDIHTALKKAHKKWNKEGRTIDGFSIEESIEEAIEDLLHDKQNEKPAGS